MEIRTVEIKNISGSFMKSDCEGLRHIKTLPCLSVVQPLHGFYEIGLNGEPRRYTEEGGAFVAPAGIVQDIVHHNGTEGYMEAHWAFLQITVNDFFVFEDVFDVPMLLDAKQSASLRGLIRTIRSASGICRKYAASYELADCLMKVSAQKKNIANSTVAQLKKYIDSHYSQPITKEELADLVCCSVPNLYRIFQKYFNMPPHSYVNKIRLEKAALLMENGADSIEEIVRMTGFQDPAYFSKLFKNKYQLSPSKYREAAF